MKRLRKPAALGQQPWLLAILIITATAGVAVVAIAFDGARLGRGWAAPLFWAGLMIILLPITVRLLGARAHRGERMRLVILLSLAFYAVIVLLSPASFTLHDELGAFRSIADIVRTGQLYRPPNPVAAAYSSYPGTLALIAALSRLSGLGIVPCGLFVIAVAKLLLTGGLFLFVERITRSSRVASIAVVLYMANPNFFFFDSQVAYESTAIGIAAMALWMVSRAADPFGGTSTDLVVAAALDGALVLTHHVTSYAVTVVIVVWAILTVPARVRSAATKRLLLLAVFSLAITGAYALTHLRATESDIGASIIGSIRGLLHVITGATAGKTPFKGAAGYSNPALEQAAGLISVALLVAALPFGIYAGWRHRHKGLGLFIIELTALLYPASLGLRLTAAGSETSNRTSEFLFVGVATVVALAFIVLLGRAADRPGWTGRSVRLLATLYVGLVFAGGITVGTAPYDLLPTGYAVGADARSVDTEGTDAARWVGQWLEPHLNFLADTTDSGLVSAYSQLDPQSGTVGQAQVGALFVNRAFGPVERRIITYDKIHYLVVDRRDSHALPHSGSYFDGGDPGSYSKPIAAQALGKFDSVTCIDRVFSSGNIVIYDTRRLLAGCR